VIAKDAAKLLRVDEGTILHYVRSGQLHAERRSFAGGRPALLLPIRDLKRLAQRRFGIRGSSRHRDPEDVFLWALRRGWELEPAQRLRIEAEKRQAWSSRRRVDTGRKPLAIGDRLQDLYEVQPEYDYVDQKPITRQERLRSAYITDWQAHPNDWPRAGYPASPAHRDEPDPGTYRRGANRIDGILRQRRT
jgi:hypothetical protein